MSGREARRPAPPHPDLDREASGERRAVGRAQPGRRRALRALRALPSAVRSKWAESWAAAAAAEAAFAPLSPTASPLAATWLPSPAQAAAPSCSPAPVCAQALDAGYGVGRVGLRRYWLSFADVASARRVARRAACAWSCSRFAMSTGDTATLLVQLVDTRYAVLSSNARRSPLQGSHGAANRQARRKATGWRADAERVAGVAAGRPWPAACSTRQRGRRETCLIRAGTAQCSG